MTRSNPPQLVPILVSIALALATLAQAQQVPDLEYSPAIDDPAYSFGSGPVVGIDQAHHNFHTAGERFQAFANLLRRDGYQVVPVSEPCASDSLSKLDILVIANPLHPSNERKWTLPNPSAFSLDEINAIHAWVEAGGSLWLIADHMPFPGAAGDLARSFGFRFSNGFAMRKSKPSGEPDRFNLSSGLIEHPVTLGRSPAETVTEIVTFTGSAFQAPKDAFPVIVFGPGWVSREPDTAWQFTEETPTRSIEGWSQGALMDLGKGRLAVFGEAASFTAQLSGKSQRKIGMNAPHAPQNHQFLLNLAHWLSRLY